MLIAVDVGNSAVKASAYQIQQGTVARICDVIRTADLQRLSELPTSTQAARWVVASVHRGREEQLRQWVAEHRGADHYQRVTHADLPLQTRVEHPHRVGVDRLASAVAANALRSAAGRQLIIVDVGTAITVDLVDHVGVFLGGAILAGPQTTAQALRNATDALPAIDLAWDHQPPEPLGRSTEHAIRSGLYWGTLGAVEMLIRNFSGGNPETVELFFTGGGGRFLSTHFPQGKYVEDLVLRGLVQASN